MKLFKIIEDNNECFFLSTNGGCHKGNNYALGVTCREDICPRRYKNTDPPQQQQHNGSPIKKEEYPDPTPPEDTEKEIEKTCEYRDVCTYCGTTICPKNQESTIEADAEEKEE